MHIQYCKIDPRKNITAILLATFLTFSMTSCNTKPAESTNSEAASEDTSDVTSEEISELTSEDVVEETSTEELGLSDVERKSIVVGKLSSECEYYDETVSLDPTCTDYISEISIYDQEIDDTFVVHVSLPPEYDNTKKYPMVVMTDGMWRLPEHPNTRALMIDGEIEPVILVSIGYPIGYDYGTIREREFLQNPDKYLHFIVDNLVPYLMEQYCVDDENLTLAGHSYGGYFEYYALFNSDTIGKNIFKNYHVGSPALYVPTGDNMQDVEAAYYSRNKSLNCNVFVTMGSDEWPSFIALSDDFYNSLEARNYEGLTLKSEQFKGYDHDHSFTPAFREAMLLFYGTPKGK